MFRSILCIVTILLLALTSVSFSQITLTASDLNPLFKVGTTRFLHSDTTMTSANIGVKGANTWDFSTLKASVTYTLTSVDPAGTPYKGDFPTATGAFKYSLLYQGVPAVSYVYYNLDTSYSYLGTESVGTPFPGTEVVSKILVTPPQAMLKLPAAFGMQWNQKYKLTSEVLVNGSSYSTSNTDVNAVYTVDAYGTLLLPGSVTEEALRIKSDIKSTIIAQGGTTSYGRSVSYSYYTKSGDFLTITTSDTTSNDTGKVAAFITWNTGSAATAVNNQPRQISTYSLNQNYPNPFNPSTMIEYSVAENSFVSLKVYDLAGREVATLFNGMQPKGSYRVNFDASVLPSGIYLARLNAGSFTRTIKMMVVK